MTRTGNVLHRQGLIPQKPLRRAYERDENTVSEWKKNECPKIKKLAKKQGAEILWLDEAAIRSDDPLQRTWSLEGQTPVVKTSGQRQSINAISALSNKSCFCFHIYNGRFNADIFIECLQDFIKYRKKPAFIIMDRHPVHKTKKVKRFVNSLNGKLRIYLFPSFAPGLTPNEPEWHQMRHLGMPKGPLDKGESLKARAKNDLASMKVDRLLIK